MGSDVAKMAWNMDIIYAAAYWLFLFRVLSRNNEISSYDRFASQSGNFRAANLPRNKNSDPQATPRQPLRKCYYKDVGLAAGDVGEVYLFSMCIPEEMQRFYAPSLWRNRVRRLLKRRSGSFGEREGKMPRAGRARGTPLASKIYR